VTQPGTPAFRRRTLSLALGLILVVSLSGPAWSLVKLEKAHLTVPGNGAKNAPGSSADVAALVSIDTGWHVNSHKPSFEYLIPTSLTLSSPTGWPAASITYPSDIKKKFTFAEQPLAVYEGDITVNCEQPIPNDTAPGSYTLTATLTYQACNDQECLPPITTHGETTVIVGSGGGAATIASAPAHPGSTLTPTVAATGPAAPLATAVPLAAPGSEPTSLALMLLLGLAGGLILNAMPCVLPVLSLKVFGLVRSAGEGASAVTKGAFTTALGILVSFWFLALAAIVAKAAGAAVGWGIQFQRPGFVAFLAIVTVLFSLNLWGLFEVELPVGLAQLGGKAAREGMAGHFASGLFATLMATPCSAPMLGTALGFALSQRWPTILAIFTAVGVGMALPYIVLGLFPTAARWLPKPGAWMETMRGILGFLLAGAAVWLLYVMAAQVSPERLATFELILVAMGLLTWFGSRRQGRAAIAVTLVALFAIGGIATASGGQHGSANARFTGAAAGLIPWVAFDRTQADTLAAKGQLVFVDVTADWCFTCKVNERLILDTPEVAKAFATHHVLPMRADWTNRDDIIGSFLAAHGRYGIPFYMLYRPGQAPVVFSELPSKSGLVEAVRLADAALKPEARS
jgi:thiol:disulfide interchange protein